jgi:RNA polymerase sigma-70 factor (ECF subfamily)
MDGFNVLPDETEAEIVVELIALDVDKQVCEVNVDEDEDCTGMEVAPSGVPAIDIPALFNEHYNHLIRFVQKYVRNAADAEDVVQNTFLEAMRCAHRFSGLSKPSTWLFGIALNLARSKVRKNAGDLLEFVDETSMNMFADNRADPASLCEVRQIVQTVDKFLSGLTPRIRETFEAVLGGEITYEEAARMLNIPIGTVRSRVSRVRGLVRAELE